MDYSFNVQLAEQYGVEEAVLLNNMYFWIQHNAANKSNFHDGQYWTYNSAQAFAEIFPFWSRQKIDRMIQKLKEKGALIIGNYNEKSGDRTRWFALPDGITAVIEGRADHCSELSNPLLKSEQPLPDNKPDINTDTNITLAHFDDFWACYPKKKSKESARKAFMKLIRNKSAPTIERLIESVKEHMKTPDWEKQDGQFIPYPATYLNGGMYDDEITKPLNPRPGGGGRTIQFDENGMVIP